MKRKVVRHGKNTMTISLPSKWVKNNKIIRGQQLNLQITEEELKISPVEKPFENIEIDINSNDEWYISMIVRHLYICGYDEILIKFNNPNQILLIRKSLQLLTGLEILESKPFFCKLRVVASLENMDYDFMIDRAFWLVLSQFDYFIDDEKIGKPAMFTEINEIFNTVSKLVNLCRRTLNKKNIYDSTVSKYAYSFLTSIRYISSFILFNYQYFSKKGILKLGDKEYGLLIKTRSYFYDLLLAYKNLDVEKTKNFFEERDRLFGQFLESLDEKNPIISHHLIQAIKYMSYIGNFILTLDFLKRSKI